MDICDHLYWVGKNQTDCHSKLLGLTNNKVKRKYGIVSIGSWTFVNNFSVPIESNRFSKWQAHAYHRKVWVPPPPRPRSPAFIDTLSSCLEPRNPNTAVFFFFFFQNQIYCTWSLPLAWLVQKTDKHDRFFSKVCTCCVCNVLFVSVGVLRPSQQRGHVEPVS